MVHGILQFTPSIAFRYVLHRCESRDIRCRESFSFQKQHTSARARGAGGGPSIQYSLALSAPGFVSRPPRASTRRGREGAARRGRRSTPPARGSPVVSNEFAGRSAAQVSTMILPQACSIMVQVPVDYRIPLDNVVDDYTLQQIHEWSQDMNEELADHQDHQNGVEGAPTFAPAIVETSMIVHDANNVTATGYSMQSSFPFENQELIAPTIVPAVTKDTGKQTGQSDGVGSSAGHRVDHGLTRDPKAHRPKTVRFKDPSVTTVLGKPQAAEVEKFHQLPRHGKSQVTGINETPSLMRTENSKGTEPRR
ncbi:hypothetical protein RND71_019097 [Anisodus tanguticus]|uniref:Uncharacterized protein n=1 Tax=Anisodus tanguticus TaxID=243964 RepID=A0AAE1VH35_9SOLA|nr:hypothetical protein RND71_019097 [Anisodus tanguticus]